MKTCATPRHRAEPVRLSSTAGRGALVQRRGASPAPAPRVAPASVQDVLRSPGRPLDAGTRGYMEPRFGHSFADVRVHTDTRADESARAMSAVAYTVGRDMVFGAGAYQPGTASGRRLLAHELAHVVQQRGSGTPGGPPRVDSTPALEHEASRAADAVSRAGPGEQVVVAGSSGPAVQRQSSPSSPSSSGSSGSSSPSDSSPSSSSGSSSSGSGAGGAPAGGGSCRIDVRATKIGATRPLGIYHLFIIYVDGAGTEWYFRGGPGNHCGTHPAPYHGILCNHGRYLPGTVDWDPSAPSVTVMSGSGACGKDSCLASEESRINAACVGYRPLGPNSNTVVSTMLSNCGIPRRKPVWIAPGWGHPNI